MKILVVSDFSSAQPGGAQVIAETISNMLASNGDLCRFRAYPISKTRIFRGISQPSIVREILSLINPVAVIRMVFLQISYKPDVIWYHNVNNRWSWAILRINIRRSKKLITLHDLTAISNKKLNSLEVEKIIKSSIFNFSRIRILITKKLIGKTITVSIGETCKNALIETGYRIDAQISNRIMPCTHTEPRSKHPNSVLFAGRPYLKGADFVAKAVARAEEWTLFIASDEEAYKLALEFCPPERIKYLGLIPRDELLKLLHSIELVAVCSQYLDNYPTIGLEALVHGAIPFTSSYTGLSRVFAGISPALVLNPGEVPDLDKILSAGNSARNQLLKAAVPVQDIESMIQEYLALFSNENIP